MNQHTENTASQKKLVDAHGRTVDYARLSITDRCDFRCIYCMDDDMHFLPRNEVLSLEELLLVAKSLIASGIRKIRLTGGEPLIRKNIMWLIERLGALEGLEELTLTTNGSQLTKYSKDLKRAGINRINVSLDTLQTEKFSAITRTGKLEQVLQGISAAKEAGIHSIKINSVILKNRNDDEILDLVDYACKNQLDISFIEEMPLGTITEHDRQLAFYSSDEVKEVISKQFDLITSSKKTNGPSRYLKVNKSNTHVGLISPHSNNFCSECNRIRVTVEGRLLLCLGNEHSIDLRALLRNKALHEDDTKVAELQSAIETSMAIKPEKHHFDLSEKPDIIRFMNMTGG